MRLTPGAIAEHFTNVRLERYSHEFTNVRLEAASCEPEFGGVEDEAAAIGLLVFDLLGGFVEAVRDLFNVVACGCVRGEVFSALAAYMSAAPSGRRRRRTEHARWNSRARPFHARLPA